MISIGFIVSKADQCLFIRQNDLGIVIFILYIDDCLLLGNIYAILFAIEQIKKEFKIMVGGQLNDFLGCEIIKDDEQNTIWIQQPHIIKKLAAKFGNEITS